MTNISGTDRVGRKPGRQRATPGRGGAAGPGAGRSDGRIAYVRVSTAREEMISPEIQLSAIRTWAAAQGVPIVDVVQDLNISGRGFAKRQVASIIERIARGEATGAVVYNFSRFGRNAALALAHIDKVEQIGGTVISATEPGDPETAIGRLTRTTALAVAEFQSDQIGDGWKAAINHRVARGLPGNGQPRFGYVYHRETTSVRTCPRGCEPGHCTTGYVVDPQTGPILADLYRAYLSGTSLPALAERLHTDRVPSVRGGRWVTTTVRDLLDTGFGAGLIVHHGDLVSGAHNAVITPEEWTAYVNRREASRTVPSRHRTAAHSTAGIAVCGLCGEGLVAASTRRDGQAYILRCGRMQSSGRGACPGVWIVRSAVEEAVLSWLGPLCEKLTAAVNHAVGKRPARYTKADEGQSALQRRMTDLGRRIGRLTEALEIGALPAPDYARRRAELEGAMHQIDLDLARLAVAPSTPPAPEVIQDVVTHWENFSAPAKRDILQVLVTRIVVHPRDADPRVTIESRWTVHPGETSADR